jgi:hypothetical protein
MIKIISLYFSIAIVFLASCSNPYEKEIKEVEDLQEVLIGVKHTYSSIEVTKVTYPRQTSEKNMSQIKMYYNPDTIDYNVVDMLDFYKGVKKSAKGFEEEYNLIGQKINFIDNQLKTLKVDLENKIDFKDSLAIFIENERSNIEMLQNNLATMVYNYDYIVSTHDTIAHKVNSILFQNVE